MAHARLILLAILVALAVASFASAQSTCPVVNAVGESRCKCGIKIDGHIYIYCARKQLQRLPKFTRSSILYDELILSGNQIERIPVNSFNGLKVKRLYLDENPIETIESGALVELANYLEELVVSVNSGNNAALVSTGERPKIPASLFQSLLNLKIVKLNGLDVTGAEPGSSQLLRAHTFNRTRKLEIIHLVDAGIGKLESSSFAGVEGTLRELNLDNNQLVTSEDIFSELRRMKRLQVLVLSRNKIRYLKRNSAASSGDQQPGAASSWLSGLDIGNGVNENGAGNAADLQLDLSFNGIVHIDEFAFGSSASAASIASQLTRLNLNNNELNQFQLSFMSQLAALKELNLDYNKIEYIPDNMFVNARSLETLSLRGNFISHLRSEFSFAGLHHNLRRLNLASNKLQSIARRVFMQTSKLRELNLERNQLGIHFETLLVKQQQQAKSAGSFSYDNELMNTFEGVESELKSINLENNRLKPQHIWSLASLINVESIRLGHNDLGSLNLKLNTHADAESDKKPAATPLKLAKLFEFYRNLTYLDLQNASLVQMPYFYGLNRTLLSLNLAQNRLCSVNANNLRKMYAKLRYFNLNSNPLSCECSMFALRQWIDELQGIGSSELNQFQRDPTLNWRCHAPAALRTKLFTQLNVNDFNCNSDAFAEQSLYGETGSHCEYDPDDSVQLVVLRTSATTKETTATSSSASSKPSTSGSTVSTSPLRHVTTSNKNEEIKIIALSPVPSTNPQIDGLLFPTSAKPSAEPSESLLANVAGPLSSSSSIAGIAASPASAVSTSFFSSIEIKQTLLGSFIGALLVVIIVCFLVGLFKLTRKRLLGRRRGCSGSDAKNLSIINNTSDSNGTEKDKSNMTTTTSPYDMGKLSLQTLCVNSSGLCCNSTGSSSSGSAVSAHTNSSCLCTMSGGQGCDSHGLGLSGGSSGDVPCIFTKMDPLRLTMISSGSNLANGNLLFHHRHHNYLALQQQSASNIKQAQQQQNANLHYLSTNLPYSPTESSSAGSSPSPYQVSSAVGEQHEAILNSNDPQSGNKLASFLNGKFYSTAASAANQHGTMFNCSTLMNDNNNTYDKLHQQQRVVNNMTCSFKPNAGQGGASILAPACLSTLSRVQLNPKSQFNTLALSHKCLHSLVDTVNALNMPNGAGAGETTPFIPIIIANGEVNQLVDFVDQTFNHTLAAAADRERAAAATSTMMKSMAMRNKLVCEASAAQMDASNESNNSHTYHEIGDVLINLNNANFKQQRHAAATGNHHLQQQHQQQQQQLSNERKPAEMFI